MVADANIETVTVAAIVKLVSVFFIKIGVNDINWKIALGYADRSVMFPNVRLLNEWNVLSSCKYKKKHG